MRTRGTGHVFQPAYKGKDGEARATSTWAIAYYDRRRKRTVREYGFASEHAAEKQLRARLSDQDRGVLTGASIERVTWKALAAMIQADYKVNRRDTGMRVVQLLKHLNKAFGEDRALDVTTDRLTAYAAARLEEGAAPATVNRELAVVKRCFRLAAQARRLSRDAMPHVPMLAERNVRQGFIEEDAFRALCRRLPPVLARVVTVAYFTGWRVPSEVLTRQWRHVDLKAGWLRIEPGEGKTEKGRMFPLDYDPRLRKALREAKAEADARDRIVPWVFARKGGERIGSFRKRWLEACTKAGVPGRLLHDLRRTAARNMLRRGIPETVAMELTGHRTRSIFSRYAIVDEAMIREATRYELGTRPSQKSRNKT